jgi:hypothetical protein
LLNKEFQDKSIKGEPQFFNRRNGENMQYSKEYGIYNYITTYIIYIIFLYFRPSLFIVNNNGKNDYDTFVLKSNNIASGLMERLSSLRAG